MKKKQKEHIAQLILYTIADAFAKADLHYEDIPDDLPPSSIIYFIGENEIQGILSSDHDERLLLFHEEATELAKDGDYNYKKLHDIITNALTEKGVHSHNPHEDAGDPLSTLLRDIILEDFGGKIRLARNACCHVDALHHVTRYGRFHDVWMGIFSTLMRLLVEGELTITKMTSSHKTRH